VDFGGGEPEPAFFSLHEGEDVVGFGVVFVFGVADAEDDLSMGFMEVVGACGVDDDPAVWGNVVFHYVMHLCPERLITEGEEYAGRYDVGAEYGAGEMGAAYVVSVYEEGGDCILAEEYVKVEL